MALHGSIQPLLHKVADPCHQPCTDTWRIEPSYNYGVLVNNWYNEREQLHLDKKREHQTCCRALGYPAALGVSEYHSAYKPPSELMVEAKKKNENRRKTGTDNPSSVAPCHGQPGPVHIVECAQCPGMKKTTDLSCEYTDHIGKSMVGNSSLSSSAKANDKKEPTSTQIMSKQLPRVLPPLDTSAIGKYYSQQVDQMSLQQGGKPSQSLERGDNNAPCSTASVEENPSSTTTVHKKFVSSPAGQGQYALLEAAVQGHNHIPQYTDSYRSTPTYAMRCLCKDCDRNEVAEVNQIDTRQSCFIETSVPRLTHYTKDIYPVTTNKRVNWIVPNHKKWAQLRTDLS